MAVTMQCTFGWDMRCSPKEIWFHKKALYFFLPWKKTAHSSVTMAFLHQTAWCLHLEDTIPHYVILLLRKNNGRLEGCLKVIKFRGAGGNTSYARKPLCKFNLKLVSDDMWQSCSVHVRCNSCNGHTTHNHYQAWKYIRSCWPTLQLFRTHALLLQSWYLAVSTLKSRFEYWLMLPSLQTENLPILSHRFSHV